jgi:hypothetical protein
LRDDDENILMLGLMLLGAHWLQGDSLSKAKQTGPLRVYHLVAHSGIQGAGVALITGQCMARVSRMASSYGHRRGEGKGADNVRPGPGVAHRLQGPVARLNPEIRMAIDWAIYILVALIFVTGSLPMWWWL